MSRAEYLEMSNVSANIAVAILRVNMYWLVDFGRLMYGRKWGGELDVMWS
jgi:hypothetical protein